MIDDKMALALRLATMLRTTQKGHEDRGLVVRFQTQEGLKPDGLYGPKTRAKLAQYVPNPPEALYLPPVVGGDNADVAALALIKTTPGGQPLSRAEQHYALTVARHETFYGRAWKDEGAGSHNWGAVQTRQSDPAVAFVHGDHHEDGTPYTTHFKKYPDDAAGLDDVIHIALKPNVRAAIAHGNGDDAVAAQRANGYFEAPLALYREAMRKNYLAFLKATSEPALLVFSSPLAGAPG